MAILALVLVAGWLLGLMSRSGGGRWKRAYEDERTAHAKLRRDYDALAAQPVVRTDANYVPPIVERRI